MARPRPHLAPAHHQHREQPDDAEAAAHMTKTSGEMKNCATSRAARTSPSRRTECSCRMTISCSVVKSNGGITSMVTDTWPKTSDETMADE